MDSLTQFTVHNSIDKPLYTMVLRSLQSSSSKCILQMCVLVCPFQSYQQLHCINNFSTAVDIEVKISIALFIVFHVIIDVKAAGKVLVETLCPCSRKPSFSYYLHDLFTGLHWLIGLFVLAVYCVFIYKVGWKILQKPLMIPYLRNCNPLSQMILVNIKSYQQRIVDKNLESNLSWVGNKNPRDQMAALGRDKNVIGN